MSIEEIHEHVAITGQPFPKVYGVWSVDTRAWHMRQDAMATYCLIPHPLAAVVAHQKRCYARTDWRVAVMPVDGSEPTEFMPSPPEQP